MTQIKATQTFRYGAKKRNAGDVFEASSADARILAAIGKAIYFKEVIEPVDEVAKDSQDQNPSKKKKRG